jgi:energy-converting hydrogenase Eha subunit A
MSGISPRSHVAPRPVQPDVAGDRDHQRTPRHARAVIVEQRHPTKEEPMSARTNSRIGVYAVVAAATAILISPLLAMAYFATADGAEYLAVATVAAWAGPGRELLGGLVTWSSADRVYATYTQVMAVMFPAVFLTALATRAQRPQPRTRVERSGWGIALAGYAMFGAGLLVSAILLLPGDTSRALVDVGFLALMAPGILFSVIGSTVLGVVFLRSDDQPRLTAWLLVLAVPLLITGSAVLGHNSFGVLPLFLAWAAAGWRWRAAQDPRSTAFARG